METDSKFWNTRICGILCLRIISKLFAKDIPNTQTLLNEGLKMGAYREEIGWIHKGLIKLASKYGLRGYTKRVGPKIKKVIEQLQKGNTIIASISTKTGGHLIVLHGFSILDGDLFKLFIRDPYDKSIHEMNATEFLQRFSGNVIIFNRP